MKTSLFSLGAVATVASAKICQNLTIPVQIEARQGVFDVPSLNTDVDVTTFVQNFTNIMGGTNYTAEVTTSYQTVTGNYQISAKFCTPDSGLSSNPAVQVLTHGIGFDKTYWDIPYNNYNYSYTNIATAAGYCTLAIDRFGIGNSSHADPYSVVQAPAEISALYQINTMLRNGTLPGVTHAFGTGKIINVGHSFGSQQSYQLATMYPNSTDAIILTGFSLNSSFFSLASFDTKLARLNQPLRFGNPNLLDIQSLMTTSNFTTALKTLQSLSLAAGLNSSSSIQDLLASTPLLDLTAGYNVTGQGNPLNYPNGYLTWSSPTANQYNFLYTPGLDPNFLIYTESNKQPFTVGEILTLGPAPIASSFTGPVYILTGRQDAIYCGGDCLATGTGGGSIPETAGKYFPQASNFTTAVPENIGHAISVHYAAGQAYTDAQTWLSGQGIVGGK